MSIMQLVLIYYFIYYSYQHYNTLWVCILQPSSGAIALLAYEISISHKTTRHSQ